MSEETPELNEVIVDAKNKLVNDIQRFLSLYMYYDEPHACGASGSECYLEVRLQEVLGILENCPNLECSKNSWLLMSSVQTVTLLEEPVN